MRIVLPLLLMLVMGVSFFIPAHAVSNAYRQISMQEAVHMMDVMDDYVIVDVRTIEEYQSGHIPGAINIPNETIFQSDIPQLPNKNQLILVYCRSGNRSRQAAAKLSALGYTNIVEFGGIHAWPGEIVVP